LEEQLGDKMLAEPDWEFLYLSVFNTLIIHMALFCRLCCLLSLVSAMIPISADFVVILILA